MHQATTRHAVIVLCLLTFIVYIPSLTGYFCFDDFSNIVSNKDVHLTSLDRNSLIRAAYSSEAGLFNRPISMLSLALNHYLFDGWTYSFKFFNVLLHITTGIFVYLFFSQLQKYIFSEKQSKQIKWLPIIITSLWLLSPLQVSTVAYIVQRMAILSTLFSLIAVVLYIHGRQILINSPNSKGFIYFIFALFFVALATLAKENGILALPIIAILELIVFRFQCYKKADKKILMYIYTMCLLSAAIIFATIIPWLNTYLENGYAYRDFTLEERMLTQARALIHYIQWFFVPDITQMSIYHESINLSTSVTSPISTLICIIALIAALIIGFVLIRKEPLISLGIFWYFIAHSLESSILPLEIMFEHRNYFPSIGMLIIVYAILSKLLNNTAINNKLLFTTLFTYVIIFSGATLIRASDWSSDYNFNLSHINHHPNSWRANYYLGRYYVMRTDHITDENYLHAKKYLQTSGSLSKHEISPEILLYLLHKRIDTPIDMQWLGSIARKLQTSPLSSSDLTSLKFLVTRNSDHNTHTEQNIIGKIIRLAASSPNIQTRSSKRARFLLTKARYLIRFNKEPEILENVLLECIDIRNTYKDCHIELVNFYLKQGNYSHAKLAIDRFKSSDTKNILHDDIINLENKLSENLSLHYDHRYK